MEFIQAKCPNCGATLEVEDSIDTFFCKYCGTKIILHGQSDAAIRAKENIELEKQHRETMKLEQELKEREDKNLFNDSLKYAAFIIAGPILFYLFCLIFGID